MCQSDTALDVGDESSSRVDMLLGTSIVMCAGFTQVGIMDLNRFDTTELHGVWRVTRVHPYTRKRIKAVRWLDLDGARRDTSENKILRSLYRKKMQEYWRTSNPLLLMQAMSMTKYANYPVPNEGACDFLEKARGAKAPVACTDPSRNGSVTAMREK